MGLVGQSTFNFDNETRFLFSTAVLIIGLDKAKMTDFILSFKLHIICLSNFIIEYWFERVLNVVLLFLNHLFLIEGVVMGGVREILIHGLKKTSNPLLAAFRKV